jgi:hypothetical protein
MLFVICGLIVGISLEVIVWTVTERNESMHQSTVGSIGQARQKAFGRLFMLIPKHGSQSQIKIGPRALIPLLCRRSRSRPTTCTTCITGTGTITAATATATTNWSMVFQIGNSQSLVISQINRQRTFQHRERSSTGEMRPLRIIRWLHRLNTHTHTHTKREIETNKREGNARIRITTDKQQHARTRDSNDAAVGTPQQHQQQPN